MYIICYLTILIIFYRVSRNNSGKIKGRKSLSDHSTLILTNWIVLHQEDPYPSQSEKELLAREANLTVKQVVDWMTNMRKVRIFHFFSFLFILTLIFIAIHRDVYIQY